MDIKAYLTNRINTLEAERQKVADALQQEFNLQLAPFNSAISELRTMLNTVYPPVEDDTEIETNGVE